MSLITSNNLGELPRPTYKYITKTEDALKYLEFIEKHPIIEVDTETTGLDPFIDKVVLLQLGVEGQSFIFDVREGNVDINIFKNLLESDNNLKLLQNALFDVKMLKSNFGITIKRLYDTMLAEQLLFLGLKPEANLQYLVAKYLRLHMPKDIATSFKDYYQEYSKRQLVYAANDVVILKDIYNLQLEQLKNKNLIRVAKLEFDFIRALSEIELNGMLLDVDKWRDILKDIEIERDRVGIQLQQILGEASSQNTLFGVSLINLDSPLQLVKALNRLGIEIESTDVKALKKYSNNPVIKLLLEYRKYEKFLTTYGEALIERIHPKTGRLHSDFKQMVDTGRLSSSNPNLQNIPAEKTYRSCFIARPGHKLITCDMSQAELRILAAYSKDPVFLEAFKKGLDLHARTAADLFGVTYEEVLADKKLPDDDPNKKHYRSHVKALNFGLCTSGDTFIITNKGIISIEKSEIGLQVAHDIGCDEIIDFKYMGKKEVYKIKTLYNYELEVTGDHYVKVLRNGQYIDVKVDEIVDTDLICIKIGSNLFPQKLYKFPKFSIDRNTNYKHFELPTYLTEDWAAFLGIFIAEGHLSVKNNRTYYQGITFGFSLDNEEFLNEFEKLLNKLFGKRYSKTITKRSVVYGISSVLLAEWVAFICGLKNKNKTKHVKIPECIKCSPKNIQSIFIKWLFERDGTLKKNNKNYKIAYSSKSKELVRDLQIMLLNFGILSSITEETRSKYLEEIYYTLSILTLHNELFLNTIGFVSSQKFKFSVDETDYNRSAYFIGQHEDKLNYIFEKYNISGQLKDRFYKKRRNDVIGNIYLKELAKYDKFFNFIYQNNIVPLPVKEISYSGFKDVYDISVNNHQYFLANGIVVHNCYGLTRVGLAIRLGVSEEKAQKLIDQYFAKYTRVAKWLEAAGKFALQNGYALTRSGRRRHFRIPEPSNPEYNRLKGHIERQGKNTPIQGCLSGQTLIKGCGRISKLVGKKIVRLDTGFGINSGIGVYSGKRKLYKVILSNGIELDITSNHKIPVISNDGELVDKTIFEIDKDNDFLLIPLNIVDGIATDLSGYKYIKGHWRETYVDYKYPSLMNEKLAFIIGCLIGDGNYSKHNTIQFVCPDSQKELFDKFNSYITDVFGYTPIINKQVNNNNVLLISGVYSVVIRGFLKHIGLDYVVHRNKVIPEYFFTETLKNKGALLNGLFSTDGGVTAESGPNYTTVSYRLAHDIQQLLLSMGINSNLKTYTNQYGNVYRLQVPKRFVKRFLELIGVSVKAKHDALINEAFICTGKGRSLVPRFIPECIYKALRNSDIYSTLSYNEKCHLRRLKVGSCSFTSWRKFYNLLSSSIIKNYLSFFTNFDFCKIRSISKEPVEMDAYDIICDRDPHYYTANGIVLHNSNADTIKQAMIYVVDRIDKAKLLSTVHDEVIVEAEEENTEEIAYEVSKALCDGFAEFVPEVQMKADAVVENYWSKD